MATSAPAAPEPKPMSSAAKLLAVFFSPGRTMAELAREPHFLLCWLVQMAAGSGYMLLLLHKVGAETLAREALMQNPRVSAMDPALVQSMVSSSAKVFHYYPYIMPVGKVAIMLLLSLIFWGVANLVLGLETRFKQLVSVVSYAYLTQTLLALTGMLVLSLMANPGAYNFVNPLGTNPAFFMDKSATAPFLFQMSLRLDLFALWTVVLLAIGLAQLGGKKGKFSTAFGATFGLYLFYALCAAGITAAFS